MVAADETTHRITTARFQGRFSTVAIGRTYAHLLPERKSKTRRRIGPVHGCGHVLLYLRTVT
jgi:hypothetical protein